MSLKKGYQLTPYGRSSRGARVERYRERLTAAEFNDFVSLKKRLPLSEMEYERLLDYMVKAGIIEVTYF